MPVSFWLDHFLDSRAEIHQIFALIFWKIEDTKKSLWDWLSFSISLFSTSHLVMMYSKVVKAGINSAGWFASEMAAYCGGNVFRLKQKLQTHNFALKSTWHIGFKMALQLALAQRTGSYWIGGRSGLSFRGVYKTPKGTTIRVASSLDEGQTFQDNRMPSRSSFCCIYSW